ncbi:hypothetical protein Clow_01630 [Corynebacterium lowii]|uniref:Uncharacterized protein n=1 Tax=Corynebacterium lowii TaxID=1544413 RepID=A0A0N8W072_9CORY|nr:hypothetical protein Clow_01630 [Corynebacterium lowii]MDP9850683.1 hypothetical protein [Corynebacterium lowii]
MPRLSKCSEPKVTLPKGWTSTSSVDIPDPRNPRSSALLDAPEPTGGDQASGVVLEAPEDRCERAGHGTVSQVVLDAVVLPHPAPAGVLPEQFPDSRHPPILVHVQ